MPIRIMSEGSYELLETINGNEILRLEEEGGSRWFAVVRGQKGDIIVRSDADHVKRRTIARGRFYLVDFVDDPKFKDMPHLFLERDGGYLEWLLPNGLPSEADPQKRVVLTDEVLDREELEYYLRHPAPAGPGEERARRR